MGNIFAASSEKQTSKTSEVFLASSNVIEQLGAAGGSWQRASTGLGAERLLGDGAEGAGAALSSVSLQSCSTTAARCVLVRRVVTQQSGLSGSIVFLGRCFIESSVFFFFLCQNKQSLHSVRFIVKLLSIVRIALIIRCFLRRVAVL